MNKVDSAIRLIRSYSQVPNLSLAYSGGKDSDVILHLAKMANVKVNVVHNVTTIDPPGTISHCLAAGATLQRPKYTFFQLVAKKGLPSMFRRFCCEKLKESYISNHLILGVRAAESNKRAERYTEPTACKVYSKTKETEQIFPIYNWEDKDVEDFINCEHINCHPLYYTNGFFDVSKRLGCLGCPLQGDRGVSDYKQYPKLLKQLVKAYAKYVETHKCIEGVYEDITWQLFYSNHGDEKYKQTYHGLFQHSAKSFLENYFQINLSL